MTAVSAPPTPDVVGSPEQNAIWRAIGDDGCGHVVVKALAGTGKSFTCRHAMRLVPPRYRVLYLAFNKAIADEFGRGAPPNCDVRTLNSVGFRVCLKALRSKIENYRLDGIIDRLFPEARRDAKYAFTKLVELCKAYLVDGSDRDRINDLAAKHEVEMLHIPPAMVDRIPDVLRECMTNTAAIDFNDQIWLPVVLDLPCDQYDIVFVDEAQDLNPVHHRLVLKLLKPRGRCVVVGDDHQAIYGFRGSDTESIDNLAAMLAGTAPVVTLPLTVTRRCPRLVVQAAQKYVPELQAMPDAPDGVITSVSDESLPATLAPGDMVLCRYNAPLLSTAYQLIRRDVKATVRGRDIGQGLVGLVKRLRPTDVKDLMEQLEKWESREIDRVGRMRNSDAQIEAIIDRCDCIKALAEGVADVDALVARIDSLFANFEPGGEPKGAVVLSSVHRAKGLEADNVYWLKPGATAKSVLPWQQAQERNLKYVAITRAKRRLVYVEDRKAGAR